MNVIKFNTIASTNQYLKEEYQKLSNLTCVTALHQTNGRGRLGRSWIDNNDLLFSILITDNLSTPSDYSFLIATTLIKVLKQFNPLVKWPNDIIINNKKVAGILLEAVSIDKIECVIIGVGLNTNTKSFSDELINKADSLSNILNKDIDNNQLLDKILKQFEIDYYNYCNNDNSYKEIIKNNFYLYNKEISFDYNNNKLTGLVIGINDNNELLVKTKEEVLNIKFGEVTLNNIYSK